MCLCVWKDKYTNKYTRDIDNSSASYIRFTFCATDRQYVSYTITKSDHEMHNKYEWAEIKAGDFIEVVYCAKDISLFALSSEQKLRRTRMGTYRMHVLERVCA